MPFKSEKQRRYLWANEPEIARDWTDTYGSRIEKNSGGISQLVKNKPDGSRPGYYGADEGHMGDTIGGKKTSMGTYTPTEVDRGGDGQQISDADARRVFQSRPDLKKAAEDAKRAEAKARKKRHKERIKKDTKKKKEKFSYKKWHDAQTKKAINKSALDMYGRIEQYVDPMDDYGLSAEEIAGLVSKNPSYGYDFSELDKGKANLRSNIGTSIESSRPNKYTVNPTTSYGLLNSLLNSTRKDTQVTAQNTLDAARTYVDMANRGASHKEYTDFRDRFKTPTTGGDGDQPLWMQLGYPSYAAWQAAQGGGGGGTTVAEKVVETESPFQKSLNTGTAQALSPYYVGANPTAANIAWGQKYGVDPRTMYMAEGGPIRQRYFLGKLVKKIGRAAKKVIKSPIGKAALMYGLGTGIGSFMPSGTGTGLGRFALGNAKQNLGALFLRSKAPKSWDMTETAFKALPWYKKINPWTGIAAASTLPFFMGGQEDDDQDKAFDYEGAKNAYMNELMRIKRGALAGSLDPNQFVYQGIKDGGRIGYAGGGSEDPMLVDEYKKYVFEMEEMGLQPMSFEEFRAQAIAGMASGGRAGYYAGGQSIPSENSMEDARKTAMQDRLGGITEVMKQADLYRQGDVGQMYMAEGGPTQEAGIMDLGGVEKDYRETGGFVPIGKEEKADDVPARLSLNEFVMTADAVRGMGDGNIDQGAERMEDLMETLEVKGKKNQGAQDMFEVSERLSAVV